MLAQRGTVEDKPRTGQPKTTTKKQDRFIITQSIHHHAASAVQIQMNMLRRYHVNVSKRTIRRRLLKSDFQKKFFHSTKTNFPCLKYCYLGLIKKKSLV